jgi:hypothetical protein
MRLAPCQCFPEELIVFEYRSNDRMLIHELHGHLLCSSMFEEFLERAAAVAAATPCGFGGLLDLLAVVLLCKTQ